MHRMTSRLAILAVLCAPVTALLSGGGVVLALLLAGMAGRRRQYGVARLSQAVLLQNATLLTALAPRRPMFTT